MSIHFMGKLYGPLNEDDHGYLDTTIQYIFHFTAAESPVDILAHASCPKRKSQYPSPSGTTTGKGLYCLHRAISEPMEGDEAKSAKYIVTAYYTNDLNRASDDEATDNEIAPWKLPPYNISVYPIDVEKAFIKAYAAGDPKGSPSVDVLNPVGDPFEAVTTEQNTVLKFSYNLRHFDDAWIDQLSDTVNAYDMSIIDVKMVKQKGRLRNLSGTFQRIYEENGTSIKYKYWQVDIEIEKQSKIWQVELMNLGYNFLESALVKRIYTDGEGHFDSRQNLITAGYDDDDLKPIDTPFKLTAAGALLSGTTATYSTFNQKAIVSWGGLSIPRSKGRGENPLILL